MGSKYESAKNEVEKYDFQTNTWISLPRLIEGGKNLSCCYFKTGMSMESLWVYTKGMIQ